MRTFPAFLLLAACVGDSSSNPPPPDGGADQSTQPDVASNDVMSTPDTPGTCDATTCGGACVDLGSDVGNCGNCGHSCGGGACNNGVCQPETLVSAMGISTLAVDPTGVYYSNVSVISTCALDSCKTPYPKQVWDNGAGNQIDELASGGGNVYFAAPKNTSGDYLYACGASSCITPVQVNGLAQSSYYGPFAYGNDVWFSSVASTVPIKHAHCSTGCTTAETLTAANVSGGYSLVSDGTSIYFYLGSANAIYKCPASGAVTCSTSSAFLGSVGSTFAGLAVAGGTLYVAIAGMSGYSNGKIMACPTSGSTCNASTFINTLGYPQAIAADTDGVFWWAQDESKIKWCPTGGCTSGQLTVASSIPSVAFFTAESGGLYWLDIANTGPSSIMRVSY